MRRRPHPLRTARAVVAALLLAAPAQADVALPSLRLEDLTWTEVAAALAEGYDTVIVPTGGTEQNGPHAALGKHNVVVAVTSERIARDLGRALVAPVIPYVPEGDPAPAPTGHMRWPGTLSVSEDTLTALLTETGQSLATHGFRRIVFLGDSGGNQLAQARAAETLNAAWAGTATRALHVSAYYDAHGQTDALAALGFTADEIGTHAALRDTSELMAVRPDAVRAAPVPPPEGIHPGNDGAPQMATPDLGALMLDLKVAAALAQIRAAE
jgi:creatinine amidohydrolase/Fe(II)-dependent formamide hydrolase-like protein